MEPTLDSIARYSWFNTFTAENWIFFLLSEPITYPFVLVTNSPLDFLLVFSFLTIIFNSFLLRVPLWAFSLFMLTPQGYLLTFNITPSFISFGVINYILLLGFRPSMFLLGVLSHLTTVLALINVLYSYKKNSLIIKVSAIGAILLISVLSYQFISEKMASYSSVQGNSSHIILAMLGLAPILFSYNRPFKRAALFYFLIITISAFISTKIASRIAFGADMLIFLYVYFVFKKLLYFASNR